MEEHFVNIIRELGSLGIIAMAAWFLFRHYLPKKDKEHREALERTQISFEKLLYAHGETFRAGMQSLASRVKRTSENIHELQRELRDHVKEESLQLETHTGHLSKIESHLEKMASE